jgi:hypothetical protein
MARVSRYHLVGQRFGRLTVLGEAPRNPKYTHRRWLCHCDCGTELSVYQFCLLQAKTTSCGCLANTRSGLSVLPEYAVWIGIRLRCQNPSARDYPRYGGRGIFLCPEWQSFDRFLLDMGPRPSPNHSVERKDNDGPYTAENCHWGTPAEQSRNKRNNVLLTHQGRTMVLKDWARETGINYYTLRGRLRRGWTVEEALGNTARNGEEAGS